MDELLELRTHIEQGRYAEALALIGEMEEMSRYDKINKIESFLCVLLVHLIKQRLAGKFDEDALKADALTLVLKGQCK